VVLRRRPRAGRSIDWTRRFRPCAARTPRQAAHSKERPLLEALLRQAEYEADLLAAQGQSGIDADWLHRELDMIEDSAD
jgi:hypothetical protein